MNAMAEKFTANNFGSIFLYTNEAHPGEHYPHLTAMEQKYDNAKDLRDIYKVSRPIYLDALEGPCHRAFGSMPNMTWIFNKSGTIIYKSDWTDVTSVQMMLDYLLKVKERRRGGERLAPFKVERLDYRVQDHEGFQNGLARSGPKAVTEFRDAF